MQGEANAGQHGKGASRAQGVVREKCAGRQGCCRGRAKAGGEAVEGLEGGGRGGSLVRGRRWRGAGRPWGGGIVTGRDENAQGPLHMAGGAFGLGSSGPERWRGLGVP